jgi:hypothetical protein
LIDAEDYRQWQRFWDQLDLVVRRLTMFNDFSFSSVESITQVSALLYDIESTQVFLRAAVEGEITSPRITEIQEEISLQVARLESAGRKLKQLPGEPGRPSLGRLAQFQTPLASQKDELREVVTAAYQRLKLK